MTDQNKLEIGEIRSILVAAIEEHRRLFLAEGVIIALLGLLAIAAPLFSSLAIEIFIGWLFFAGGVLRLAMLLRAKHLPGFWWSLLGAVLAIVIGLVLAFNPFQGLLTLTMVLIALFLVEGFSAIFAAFDFRAHSANWGWLLLSGVVDLVLAGMIWQSWPASAAWAIGLLTGVNLFFLGLSLIMLAIAAPSDSSKS